MILSWRHSYHLLLLISTDHKRNLTTSSALLPDRPFKPRFRFVFIIFRRIGRDIAFNVYAVAVIYVRFAILTLVMYLMATWFFKEYEMVADVQKSQTEAAQSPRAPSTAPPLSSQLEGDLWGGVGFCIYGGKKNFGRSDISGDTKFIYYD